MLKLHQDESQDESIDWKKHLTQEEFNVANQIKSILLSNQPIHFERASKEKYALTDNTKDPYELFLSISPKSKSELHTDGKITRGKIINLANGEMQSISVSDYNYIIVKQHLPNPKNNGADSWYQSIVTKTYALKLYVQNLLKLALG